MQTQQTPETKAKRIRLTVKEIKQLPREYQHQIKGAVELMKLLRENKSA